MASTHRLAYPSGLGIPLASASAASLVLCVFLGCEPAMAQVPAGPSADGAPAEAATYAPNEPARALKEGKVVGAFRMLGAPPAIDGRPNEDVWTFAEMASGFVQRDPDNGNPVTGATRLQVAYDDRYLYVALTCDDSAPEDISDDLGRRDEFPAEATRSSRRRLLARLRAAWARR